MAVKPVPLQGPGPLIKHLVDGNDLGGGTSRMQELATEAGDVPRIQLWDKPLLGEENNGGTTA
eukprot:10415306-Lingulodinium_polyedra.AAC.1